MLYILNWCGTQKFDLENGYKGEKWMRIYAKDAPDFGINILRSDDLNLSHIDGVNFVWDGLHPLSENICSTPVSVSFDRKTLEPYIIRANNFSNDIFICAVPLDGGPNPDIPNEMINHSSRGCNILKYYMTDDTFYQVYTLRAPKTEEEARSRVIWKGTFINQTFIVPKDRVNGELIISSYKSYGIYMDSYKREVPEFVPISEEVEYPINIHRTKYIRDVQNVSFDDDGQPEIRRFYPFRPTHTVISTKPSKEGEIRELLKNRYNMEGTRVNLVMAKDIADLEKQTHKLKKQGVTAVTYCIGTYENGLKAREEKAHIAASLDEKFFAKGFEKVFVLSPNGDVTFVRI